MRLVSFRVPEGERIGALHREGFVVDFTAADARHPATMQALIEAGEEAWSSAREWTLRAPARSRRLIESVKLLSPLPRPIRLRDASLFLEHMEAGLAKLGKTMHPEFRRQVIYYNADHLHVFGPDCDIPWPAASEWIDYELEWACVVGKTGIDIALEDARSHIIGFTIFNDWSARDLQFSFMEAGLGPGAGKDFANSIGPCIATLDEFEDPYVLAMSAAVNGEIWSNGTTASMEHRFEDAICQFSRSRPLHAGEVIGSGTVLDGCGFELDRRLAIGDVVDLRVEGVGSLRNKVVRAGAVAHRGDDVLPTKQSSGR